MKKILWLLFFAAMNLQAQIDKTSELFVNLQKHDSIFFEKSFNQCDLVFLEQAIHPNLIFFHDQGGMQDKKVFFESVRKNICGNASAKPIRKVRRESLEVYPLYDNGKLYGAIQTGVHDFYLREKGQQDRLTSTAKFSHVYLLENGKWLLREVLSFDHK